MPRTPTPALAAEETDPADNMPDNLEARTQFQSFGELLRYLRETFTTRIGQNRPGMPHVSLTALSLIQCLKHHGYPITSGAYSELESGATLPRDPERFFEAAGQCLAVDQSSPFWLLMRKQYARDLLSRYLKPDTTEILLG